MQTAPAHCCARAAPILRKTSYSVQSEPPEYGSRGGLATELPTLDHHVRCSRNRKVERLSATTLRVACHRCMNVRH